MPTSGVKSMSLESRVAVIEQSLLSYANLQREQLTAYTKLYDERHEDNKRHLERLQNTLEDNTKTTKIVLYTAILSIVSQVVVAVMSSHIPLLH